MIDRRAFMSGSLAVATALATGCSESRSARRAATDVVAEPARAAVALVDRRLEGSAAFAAAATARGLCVLEFSDDAGSVWMRDLEPRLRAGPVAIVGFTSPATAFCLELLARDYGARTVQRAEQGAAETFVISQLPGRRATLAPRAVRAQWRDSHA